MAFLERQAGLVRRGDLHVVALVDQGSPQAQGP